VFFAGGGSRGKKVVVHNPTPTSKSYSIPYPVVLS